MVRRLALLLAVAAAATAGACTLLDDDPPSNTCTSSSDCFRAQGETCNMQKHICEVTAWALEVERVSIWRYSADTLAIECVDLYEVASGRHSSGMSLQRSTYPCYFTALRTNELIAVDDVHHDPRTHQHRIAGSRMCDVDHAAGLSGCRARHTDRTTYG